MKIIFLSRYLPKPNIASMSSCSSLIILLILFICCQQEASGGRVELSLVMYNSRGPYSGMQLAPSSGFHIWAI